jgi:hypothetical protein
MDDTTNGRYNGWTVIQRIEDALLGTLYYSGLTVTFLGHGDTLRQVELRLVAFPVALAL